MTPDTAEPKFRGGEGGHVRVGEGQEPRLHDGAHLVLLEDHLQVTGEGESSHVLLVGVRRCCFGSEVGGRWWRF